MGFVFLPTTTMAYAVARNSFTTPGGGFAAFGVIAMGVALDLGLLGGSGRGIGKRR